MKKIFSILLMGVLVVGLTGCGGKKGDSRFDYIIDQLNNAVDEVVERNNDKKVTISRMEDRLTQNISSARIIGCGEKEFTKDVDLTQTSYRIELNGYDGKIYYSNGELNKDSKVNYCLVFATNARGYLNVTVGYDGNKPVFSIPELLNGD